MRTLNPEMRYHRLLGVDPGASPEEIRTAYRKLARQYHPDANPGNAEAERKFKEISEAYGALSSGRHPQDAEYAYGDIDTEAFRAWRPPGGDLLSIVLDLLSGSPAFKFNVPPVVNKGRKKDKKPSGKRQKSRLITCPQCNGTGHVSFDIVIIRISGECLLCGGSGSI